MRFAPTSKGRRGVSPVVVVFEDLHWADEPTFAAVAAPCATHISTAPMFMVCTYRDVGLDATRPFAGALETLVQHKQAARLLLRRSPLSGVKGMLAALGVQPPLRRLCTRSSRRLTATRSSSKKSSAISLKREALRRQRQMAARGCARRISRCPRASGLCSRDDSQRLSEGAQRVLVRQ